MLLDNGANIDFFALFLACAIRSNIEAGKLLLGNGVNIVKVLLENEANYDWDNNGGAKILNWAVKYGCVATSKLIINSVLFWFQYKEKPNFIKENNELSAHWDKQIKIVYMLKSDSIGRPITENTISVYSRKDSLKALAVTKFFDSLSIRKIEKENYCEANKSMEGSISKFG